VEGHRCWCWLVKGAQKDAKDGRENIASAIEVPQGFEEGGVHSRNICYKGWCWRLQRSVLSGMRVAAVLILWEEGERSKGKGRVLHSLGIRSKVSNILCIRMKCLHLLAYNLNIRIV